MIKPTRCPAPAIRTALILMLTAQAALPVVAVAAENPLLTESTLPFRYPRFDLIKDAHFPPAFEQGMAEHLREVAAIADNPAKPTFDNTVVALERAGRLLGRVNTTFSNLTGTLTNPELQKIQRSIAPQLSAHNDAVRLNPALFARLSALYDARSTLGLDAESQRLLWRYYQDFVRAGAKLAEPRSEERRVGKEC